MSFEEDFHGDNNDGSSIIMFIILVTCVVIMGLMSDNTDAYKNKMRQDLIDHKIITHDPTTGKLVYTSDKSPFNY